jgi:beta-galactosidase/beta-glucuronidase
MKRFLSQNKINPLVFISLFFLIEIECSMSQGERNIALMRAVYQSSAANFDNTGQLVTDGIFTVDKKILHSFSDQYADNPEGESPEFAFDGKTHTKWLTFHNAAWIQICFPENKAFQAVYYQICSGNDGPERDPESWTVEGSNDGVNFQPIDVRENEVFNKRNETKIYRISEPGEYACYRLNILSNHGDYRTQLAEWDLLDENGKTMIDRNQDNKILDSRWISSSGKNEWLYIDLGAVSSISSIHLYWADRNWASVYDIQLSDNAEDWETVFSQETGTGGQETCPVKNGKARYVRLFCRESIGNVFNLVELEVYGSNDVNYRLEQIPETLANGTQYLRGGNWRLQRASQVGVPDGIALSQAGFDDRDWLPAKVPGTVLSAYREAGAIPDPNYGDQQLFISDSYFTCDFWYRNHFSVPDAQRGKTVWLNFDAINWKAEVYFNGSLLGRINGAFIRTSFDITNKVNYGAENYLAVLIYKNDNPGAVTLQTMESPGGNGGILGADNPTIHASVGWDWVPTIRGRNIGIYNDVFISYTQEVQLRDPWIITDLNIEEKDFSKAALTVKTELYNAGDELCEVVVSGVIQPGNYTFECEPFRLKGKEMREVTVSNLTLENPRLWWPNTYGEPFLYTAELTAYINGKESDRKEFEFGVREFTYKTDRPLTVYCNGTRIVCRGGNWGMDDSNLAAGEEDYNTKVRLHAEANLTMIRNWVGMTGNEAFYRACDRYGILIWDDFWLANPGDGPNPNDEVMFMQNAEDKIKRNRYHAALALYCGRNEGDPPLTLNESLAGATQTLDGSRPYIPHSAGGSVSGFGPYSAQDTEYYYKNTGATLHSERGMPNIPALESLERMLPPEHRWPIDAVWGIHDFTLDGAQGGRSFLDKMRRYENPDDLPSFARIAQMVNYETHKSMFEAVYTNGSNGMLMWMSQSAWPSMVWQTYDYYYDTNGGYFGAKKANQPVNAIYNPATGEVVLCNSTAENKNDLNVILNVFDQDGKLLRSQSVTQSIAADKRQVISTSLTDGLSGLLFIKTQIKSRAEMIADNFTWVNLSEKYNYSALSRLPEANLTVSCQSAESREEEAGFIMTVKNTGTSPALMIRIKTVNGKTKELILPVYYEDNYFSLMPGEFKTVSIKFSAKYLKDSNPEFYLEGWNRESDKIDLSATGQVSANSAITASIKSGLLFLNNVPAFSEILIYNTGGTLIEYMKNYAGDGIFLPQKGFYIANIRNGNKTESLKAVIY